jgi:ribosomal protein S18 acetylase RimI-like enzyme
VPEGCGRVSEGHTSSYGDPESIRDRLLTPDEWRVAREARLAALRDSPTLLLARQPPETVWTEDYWRRSCASGQWAVAQVRRRTVGLARLSPEGTDAYVESVWTDPRYRRCGVASALVKRLVSTSRGNGSGDIFVWVVHPNPAALRLYVSLGFEPTGDEQVLAELGRIEQRLRFNGEHQRS